MHRDALVLLMGNSHANCMVNALKSKSYAPEQDIRFRVVTHGAAAFPGGLVLTDSLGRRMINPVVQRALDLAIKDSGDLDIWVVSVIGGNAANRMGLFKVGQTVSFLLPDECDAPSSGASAADDHEFFIPFDCVAETLRQQIASLGEFFELLPRARIRGVIHLEGPSPAPDNTFVFHNLPSQTRKLAEGLGVSLTSENDIQDPLVRHRLWLAQALITKSICKERGVKHLMPPASSCDPQGLRILDRCADSVHGTTEYGIECLREIATAIRAERSAT